MRSLALFDALQDFSQRSQPGQKRPVEVAAAAPAPVLQKAPDIEAIVAERVAAAEAVLRERLGGEHTAALVAFAEEHEARLAALHADYGQRIGGAVASAIAEAESRITGFAVASLARTVGSLLSDDIQKRSIAGLARAIRDSMSDRDAVRIRVSGPASLFEALRGALGTHAEKLDFTEAGGFDLVISIDGNPIETRLSEWSAGLSEILA